MAHIDLEWPISPNSQLFQSFPAKLAHFWPNVKTLGGYIGQIFPDLQLFELFPTAVAQNDPQWPILPLKWLGLAQNGQFWSIFNFCQVFPPKTWLILTWNGQFHPIHNFSNLFPPNWLIFGQMSKLWGGTLAKFSQICSFLNCFQLQWLKMTHNGQFCH